MVIRAARPAASARRPPSVIFIRAIFIERGPRMMTKMAEKQDERRY
jgi:hypothetical protein